MSGSGDYISRNAAIEAMYKDAEAHQDHTFWTSQFEALKSIPAADARPVVNTCETCGYKTEQIRVKPYDGACWYWKLHSIKNEEWCCHWKQREES